MPEVEITISTRSEEVARTYGLSLTSLLEEAIEQAVAQRLPTMKLSPRSRRVIEASTEEAQRLGHDYVGTEHLLLGLLSEPEGIAAHVLTTLGVAESARARILEIINQPEYSQKSDLPYYPEQT